MEKLSSLKIAYHTTKPRNSPPLTTHLRDLPRTSPSAFHFLFQKKKKKKPLSHPHVHTEPIHWPIGKHTLRLWWCSYRLALNWLELNPIQKLTSQETDASGVPGERHTHATTDSHARSTSSKAGERAREEYIGNWILPSSTRTRTR